MNQFMPKIGDPLTVELPNEAIRATVINVLTKNIIEAELNLAQPFTRIHGYGYGQRLRFRRTRNVFGEKWAIIEGQAKALPPLMVSKVHSVPGDDPAVPDDPPRPPPKAKRRSEMEADKSRKVAR